MKTLTMITRHGATKENITGYTLITSDYQTVQMSAKDLAAGISGKKFVVTNMEVTPKGLASINGALDKYTFVNTATNQVEGTARAVILDRVEQGGKLIGYTVFTQNGMLAELSVADAAALADKKMISNGKIKHTAEGNIVSAIGGTYPLREIPMNKAPKGEASVNLMYFGTVVGAPVDYFGAIISCTSATEMSKITDALSKSNAKVIATVAKVGGQHVRESLAIKRFGANSLYGVFEVAMLAKLSSAGAKVQSKLGSLTVSAIKYVNDGVEEDTIKLSTDWKVIESNVSDSDTGKKVKTYTKKLVDEFSAVKVEK